MKIRTLLSSTLLVTALAALPAFADSPAPASQPGEPPVLLNADYLAYDEKADIVSAEGSVRLAYKGETAEADKVVYNRRTGVVTADGHVKVWQASGDTRHSASYEIILIAELRPELQPNQGPPLSELLRPVTRKACGRLP